MQGHTLNTRQNFSRKKKLTSTEKSDRDWRIHLIKECLRKEGVTLNDRIWARLEKHLDTSWKW